MSNIEKTEDAQIVETGTAFAINKSELESQLDAAHRYPRKTSVFLEEATTLATLSEDVAESCMYTLERKGSTKPIAGPSVRLAEICASAYGNLHVASRVVEDTGKEIVARGIAWDIEKNLKVEVETRRRITGRDGRRYSDDMIVMTGNAAASIALRNALFRVIPRAYVDTIYARAKAVAAGDAKTLAAKRGEVVEKLKKMGVPSDRILARVGAAKIEDVGQEELVLLIGFGSAIKNQEQTIDEAFPPPDEAPARAKALADKLKNKVEHDADGVVQ